MSTTTVRLSLVQWALCLVGLAAPVITAMVARPIVQPPELVSISNTARAVDRSAMPGLQRFHARDGTELADEYEEAVGERVPVRLIDGVNHMGIVSDPLAVSAIAEDVVTRAMAGS